MCKEKGAWRLTGMSCVGCPGIIDQHSFCVHCAKTKECDKLKVGCQLAS
jgi:hypothetical protein